MLTWAVRALGLGMISVTLAGCTHFRGQENEGPVALGTVPPQPSSAEPRR